MNSKRIAELIKKALDDSLIPYQSWGHTEYEVDGSLLYDRMYGILSVIELHIKEGERND